MDAFEQPRADAAEDRRVDARHLLKIGGRQLNDLVRDCRRRCAGWADVPRQRRVEHEAMTLVQRPAERRRVEPNRQLRRECGHRRLEQARPETTAAILRRHQHHRNPAAVDVVDPDRRADDAVAIAGDEAPGRRELDETAPILEPLIPAHERAQCQRTVEMVGRQGADVHVCSLIIFLGCGPLVRWSGRPQVRGPQVRCSELDDIPRQKEQEKREKGEVFWFPGIGASSPHAEWRLRCARKKDLTALQPARRDTPGRRRHCHDVNFAPAVSSVTSVTPHFSFSCLL